MRLLVYKGFHVDFLKGISKDALLSSDITDKLNVLSFDKKYRKSLDRALLDLDEHDEVWVTYEEFTLIKSRVADAVEDDGLEVVIIRNNMYPDYYPISFDMDDTLVVEIRNRLENDNVDETSELCDRFLAIYNTLVTVDGTHYGSFYNYEYDREEELQIKDFYPANISVEDSQEDSDYDVFINEDVDTYLRDLNRISDAKPSIIGVKSTNGMVANRIQKSLQAYCVAYGIRLVNYHEKLTEDIELENELINIAKNDIKISGFQEFRTIPFYKNPDIDKETVEVSQGQLIQEIIRQAENSYNDDTGNKFRDIFITASTGAGKSVMFQIPAVYLAKKHHKLTIIIEPVKALMQDQKEKLQRNGYTRVEAFNSDLISQVEKEAVLRKIRDGEVDLLYLSPETLLSYSIETIIGEREIGLLIIDEAHIVTTWGVGFRPDYWYLGGYINRLRNQAQTVAGKHKKTYKFPICAFTATAINGGVDDSVSDTVISLYMENPIKYIGYVRRDDIKFEIVKKDDRKLPKQEYEEKKSKDLDVRLRNWIHDDEKTIVYFPFASLAGDAYRGVRAFAGIIHDSKKIGTYTGRNIDELSNEAFNEAKKQTFEKFRSGTMPVMLATKAFGMGVDVNDVQNVYHYAVTGNLCDYVQEIGRAARKQSMIGTAITDFYYNDLTFMKVLFGMSQIKQYQILKVLEGIYDTYKSKKEARSFLISPESFTYIFNGKGAKDEGTCINKLKTSLLMLEKDFYDKYNYKVIVSRPQSVFTKAFVVIQKENEDKVLNSKYGKCFKFVEKGRYHELQADGSYLSDAGDIYSLDLKRVWEEFYPNISFPQFKYWYFNSSSTARDKVDIMPTIIEYFSSRQKVSIETRGDLLLSDLRDEILKDFEYLADTLYAEFGRSYFTADDFAKIIKDKYGMAQARIIANSIFDLVDPDGYCIKHRSNETTGRTTYVLSNGNFKELLRKPIIKSRVISNLSRAQSQSYSSYLSLASDDRSTVALKLLSIFDYITYEVAGGEEPEIFIRLNDPEKIKAIVLGNAYYSNSYVTKARQKHDRDISILLRFFNALSSDKERWDYIEDYFLGYDVLCDIEPNVPVAVKMTSMIDKEHSYPTTQFKKWSDFASFYDENDHVIIGRLAASQLPIPEYLETVLKKSDLGENILMSWPSKNVAICQQDTTDSAIQAFEKMGWNVYRIYDIDFETIKGALN